MTPATPRGEFRSVYVVILDTEEYEQLTAPSKLVLLTLKLMLPWSGIAVLSPNAVKEKVGLSLGATERALVELAESGWIRRERNVVWLVNGLKFEPHLSPKQEKHREGVQRRVASVPRVALVDEFKAHYPEWFAPIEPKGKRPLPSDGGSEHDAGNNGTPKGSPSHADGITEPPLSVSDGSRMARLSSTTSLSQNTRTTDQQSQGREGQVPQEIRGAAEIFSPALVDAYFAAHPDELARIESAERHGDPATWGPLRQAAFATAVEEAKRDRVAAVILAWTAFVWPHAGRR